MNRRIATIALSLAVVAVIILISGCTKQQSTGPLPKPQAAAGTPLATEEMPTLTPAAPGGSPAAVTPEAPASAPAAGAVTATPSTGPSTAPQPAQQPTTAPAVQPTQAPSGGPTTHTVKPGEWLYSIARLYNVSPYALIQANPGINPNYLRPGQVLNIPGGGSPAPTPVPGTCPSPYTVQLGDTVYSIARKCGKTPSAIITANNLFNPNFIFVGQKLQIP
jgi:LysM repeat protein